MPPLPLSANFLLTSRLAQFGRAPPHELFSNIGANQLPRSPPSPEKPGLQGVGRWRGGGDADSGLSPPPVRPSLLGQAPPGPVSARPSPGPACLPPSCSVPTLASTLLDRDPRTQPGGARATNHSRERGRPRAIGPPQSARAGPPEAPAGPLTLSHVPISARPATATARTSPLKAGLPARARCGGDVGAAPERGCPARPHGPSLRSPRRKVPAAESVCIRPREGQTWGGQGPPNSDRIQPK